MELDSKAWKILSAVQRDGRISLKALADQAGLSVPAVSERLKRLEEAGVVTGYRAEVDPVALGYGVMAMIGNWSWLRIAHRATTSSVSPE